MKIFLFLAEGFEEIEALAPVDIFRRSGIEVETVSVSEEKTVTAAHGITVLADQLFDQCDFSGEFLIYLPGGMPGTANLGKHEGLKLLIEKQYLQAKKIAAICAAPSILGNLGMLKGKEAICYPGFESSLIDAKISKEKIVKSDHVYTAKAAGVAIPFALKIVEELLGKEVADKVSGSIYY